MTNRTLYIKQPYIEALEDKARLICDIIDNNEIKQVYFEVDTKYSQYLCYERCDAFVIGLLNYAMRKNLNIQSDAPITEMLLYNIEEHLIPSLTKHDKDLYKIKITAEIESTPIKNAGAIGTGLSCGIDSFHAIYKNYNNKFKGLNLTHLCINNVGAFSNSYKEYGIEKTRSERYKIAQEVADNINLPLLQTDSNFLQAFPQDHYLTNSYSSVFAIYCLQKLWQCYFLGSVGLDYNSFTLEDNSKHDSACYDLLSLQCFSHSNLKIFSEGGAEDRLEKTKDILDYEVAQKYLHVCTCKPYNCNVCPKCMRTILSLYALGSLDKFKKVFDIEYFKKHKNKYFNFLCKSVYRHDKMLYPIYNNLKKQIPLYIKIDARIKANKLIKNASSIFSIKNEYVNDKKYKVLTIMGIKVKF